MAWSIFREGGGKGAAVTWAQDLQKNLGIQVNATDTQFIYDWELAEGGGGKFNPLNQGPVPGHPELTSTGQQFGGGAADFVSWQAGLTGSVDYLHMPNFQGILKGLQDKNYGEAKSALVASPWAASHYGGGANFPNTPAPGASQLASGGGNVGGKVQNATLTSFPNPLNIPGDVLKALNPIKWIEDAFGNTFKEIAMRLGLILLGGIVIVVGIIVLVKTDSSSSTADMADALKSVVENEKSAKSTGAKTVAAESAGTATEVAAVAA